MKKVVVWLLALIMVFSMVACGGSTEAEAPAAEATEAPAAAPAVEEEQLRVALSMHSQSIAFTKTLAESFKAQAEERGWKCTVTDANADSALQVSQIEDLVAQKPDYLVVSPVDASALGNALQTAVDAGIPVINVNTALTAEDHDKVECIIMSDNHGGGVALGEWLVENLPENSSMGILNYPQVRAIDERVQAMMGVLEEKRPDVTMHYQALTDLSKLTNYVEDMLMAHNEINSFFAIADEYAIAAKSVCAQNGKPDAIAVGFDGSPAGKQAVRDDDLTATCVNSCISIATAACEAIDKLVAGEALEFNISTAMWVIDKTNVEQYGYDSFN